MALTLMELRSRMTEWRNLKQLHAAQKRRVEKLEAENRDLRKRYEEDTTRLKQQLETALIRIGELEEKIFGRKREKEQHIETTDSGVSHQKNRQPRTAQSYHRPVPADTPTETQRISVTTCKHCGGTLARVQTVIRYIEDIILPQLTGQITKTLTKLEIERGYCAMCGVWTAASDLRGEVVTLGKNVRLLIPYLVTLLDCSYAQVKMLLIDLYGLGVSDGEIGLILREQAIRWQPEYERLKQTIRGQPGVHLDETTWPIQIFAKHTYAWVMSGVETLARIYKLATSRGKGHALDLLGETFDGIRITDCFPGYKHLNGLQQICWAHLYRKIRDLVDNSNLPEEKRPVVTLWYEQFSQLYTDLRAFLAEPFDLKKRMEQISLLRLRLEPLRQPDHNDPKKLHDLKQLLTEYDHALFTCMRFDGIPCDNNRAERDLRPLVIKRKKSFGSRTESGAHALEILLSVCWSTWHMNRGNFLPTLARLSQSKPLFLDR